MPISDRTKQLFDQMRKLAAELAALGHQRDETQVDAMLGYPVRGDLLKLLRDWERKLQQIVKVESDLKDALITDGILSKRKKKRKSPPPEKSGNEREALNRLRAAALNALSAVTISLDRRTLTQEMIVTARRAVASLLDQLQAP